jgi:hypothetical protein
MGFIDQVQPFVVVHEVLVDLVGLRQLNRDGGLLLDAGLAESQHDLIEFGGVVGVFEEQVDVIVDGGHRE